MHPHLDINENASPEAEPVGDEKTLKASVAQPIRARTALFILLTQIALLWWIADSEISVGVYLVCYSIMIPTALYLFFVRLLRRHLPFNDNELLLSYVVLTCTLPIVGFGGLRFLIEGQGFMSFFSKTQPWWTDYLPFLSKLPVLHDPEAIKNLYLGNSGIPWRAWAAPIGFWSLYLLLLSGLWLSLAGIFRRTWVTQERLTFPVATIPLQILDPKNDVFRRTTFWLGFTVPAVFQSLLVFHQWIPTIPAIQLKVTDVKPLIFTTPPWDAIPFLWIGVYPMAVGLAYFVPSNITFSCWFLTVVMKLLYVVGAMIGIGTGSGGAARFPFREEQAVGAWITIGILVLLGARYHWKSVWKQVADNERAGVRMLSLSAFACACLCAVMMTTAGIPVIASLGVVAVYAAYVICGARIRAEAGGMWIFAPGFWTPHRVMNLTLGTKGMGTGSLVAGGYFDLIHMDIRAQSLPYLMEGMYIAEKSGIRARTVLLWTAAGMVTAIAVGWWSTLSKLYSLGAATAKTDQLALWTANRAFNEVGNYAVLRPGTDWTGLGAMGFGAIFTVLCVVSRRLGPFALHPIGYAASNTLTIEGFVLSFFIAWAAKTTALRLGGAKGYRNSILFFVGLIFGDVVTQGLWTLIGWILHVPIYKFLS